MPELFSWGNNTHGQLGVGFGPHSAVPRRIAPPSSPSSSSPSSSPSPLSQQQSQSQSQSQSSLSLLHVRSLAVGPRHVLCMTHSGDVYSWGNNDFGQLAQPTNVDRPTRVDSLNTYQIVQAACGMTHSLAVTEDNRLLSWGKGDRGQLGLGLSAMALDSSKPKFLKGFGDAGVVQVACGYEHCMALCENGSVWTWGDNSHGQLGFGDYIRQHTPTLLSALHGRPIVKIVCGAAFSGALTVSGNVYLWGDNTFGQLGTGDTMKLLRPKLCDALLGNHVVDICCGESHIVVLTDVGHVLTFGAGSHGQLGHQSTQHQHFPKTVMDLLGQRCTYISCGRHHTVVYQADVSRMYSFGLNGSGQLGDGSTISSNAPKYIHWQEPGFSVHKIFAGGDQTFVLLVETDSTSAAHKDVVRLRNENHPPLLSLSKPLLEELLALSADGNGVQRKRLHHLCETVFVSPSCLNASFLSETHYDTSATDPGISITDVHDSFTLLWKSGDSSLVVGIGNAISHLVKSLYRYSTKQPEPLRVFLILLQNPLFLEPSLYHVVCQQLAQHIIGLNAEAKDILSSWFRHIPSTAFAQTIKVFQAILSFLAGKKAEERQIDLEQTVTSSCMILEWFNRVNLEGNEIVSYKLFHNPDVSQNLDIIKDYLTWRTQPNLFCFAKYPFLLSPDCKTKLLRLDATLEMQYNMDMSVLQTLTENTPLELYLTFRVRREHLVEDTIDAMKSAKSADLKKPLVVKFEGEEALDEGGVQKEFFFLVFQELLSTEYGLFIWDDETRYLWFNEEATNAEALERYRWCGCLFGMAIYNGCLVNAPFPQAFFKKLLGVQPDFDDLKAFQPSLAHGLEALLNFPAERFDDAFAEQRFEVLTKSGRVVPLRPNGGSIAVAPSNRKEYVSLYRKFILETSIQAQFEHLQQGFSETCSGPILKIFNSLELESLLCGSPNYNFYEMEQVARYANGFSKDHPLIKSFWQVLHSMPTDLKKKFLLFVTGSDRAPFHGLDGMPITIQRVGDPARLPVAHTCFNLLDLPEYASIGELRDKLTYAISNTEGFGLI